MNRSEFVSTLALSSAALAARPLRTLAQGTLEHIRMAGPPTEDLTSFYYAIKNGLFRRAGLDVELVGTSSGAAATTAVIAGTYEIGKTSPVAVFAAHLRNIPIVVVAPELMYTTRNPFALLQIATDAPYKTGADLNGKTVGVPALNDLNTCAARAWVDKNGGDWKSLKFVEIPNSAMEPALQQHRIDAAVIQSPQLDASVAAGTTKTLGDAYAAIAPVFAIGLFIARADWTSQHAGSIRKFARVMADASGYVNTHPVETAPLVAELTKIELANTQKMHRAFIATSLDLATIQPLIDASAKFDLLPHGFPAREIIFTEGR